MAEMGRRQRGTNIGRYTVYVRPEAWQEIKRLPGHVKQRVKRAIDGMADDPRPPKSIALDMSEVPEFDVEVRRLRLDRWRIIYAIDESNKVVDVLAIRKRPPYDYGDLAELLESLL